MKKHQLIFILIILLSIGPGLYVCVTAIKQFSVLESNEVAASYEIFSKQVESGKLTNKEISEKLIGLSKAEYKISSSNGLFKLSYLYITIAIGAVGLLQAYLLRSLVKHLKS